MIISMNDSVAVTRFALYFFSSLLLNVQTKGSYWPSKDSSMIVIVSARLLAQSPYALYYRISSSLAQVLSPRSLKHFLPPITF